MEKITVGNISIEYEKEHLETALELKKVLTDSNELFEELFPGETISLEKNSPGKLSISSIEEFQKVTLSRLPNFFETIAENESEIRARLLQHYLTNKHNFWSKYALNKTYRGKAFYLLISHFYNKSQIIKIPSTILFEQTPEEKKVLEEWLENDRETNFALLSLLIEREKADLTCSISPDYDNFLDENFSSILKTLETYYRLVLKEALENNKSFYFTPSLSQKELENYCRHFLLKTDPSLEWLIMYEKARREGKITFDTKTHYAQLDYKASRPLKVELTKTIIDFIPMTYLLIKYLSEEQKIDHKSSNSVSKFSRIYYEELAEQFLRENGYNEKLMDLLTVCRHKETATIYEEIAPILALIAAKKESREPLTYENVLLEALTPNSLIYQTFFKAGLTSDEYKITDISKICQQLNMKLLSDDFSPVVKKLNTVIGDYLAHTMTRNNDGNYYNKDIVSLVNSKTSTDLEQLAENLNLDQALRPNKVKEKIKKD